MKLSSNDTFDSEISMSCFTCAIKFGWRKKEYGCKHCGKAFCKDCLSHKVVILKHGSGEQNVCNICFKDLTRKTTVPVGQREKVQYADDASTYFGPSMKDIAASSNSHPSDPDAQIKARLKLLKQEDTSHTTDADIQKKFEDVTGRTIQTTQKANILMPQKKLTEAEEVLNLLKQTKEEVNIDEQYDEVTTDDGDINDKITNMEHRLMKLKDIDPEAVKEKHAEDYDSSEDEHEATKRIIKKALAESQLDDKVKEAGYGDLISSKQSSSKTPSVPSTAPGLAKYTFNQSNVSDEDELPWCCICNNDATVRCHDCDDDLYCKRCFREGHDEFDMKYHRTTPYKAKKTK